MLPITIDISPIIDEFDSLADKSSEFGSFVLGRLAESYGFGWENLVNAELKSTRSEYKKAMHREQIDDSTVEFALLPRENQLPMMIEGGASQFDIKEGFKKSSKAVRYSSIKDEKEHWYLTIPFRFASSGALGESSIFSRILDKPIEKIAKDLNGGAIMMKDLPKEYQRIGINKQSGVSHTSPLNLGVKRQDINSTNKENRGGYVSFRRVSDNTEDGKWQHPGFEPHNFMDRASSDLESNMKNIVDKATNDFLTELFG